MYLVSKYLSVLALTAEQVKDLSSKPYVARELMLIKVRCTASQRRELSDLADIFHGTVCDVSLTTITLELQGKEDKMHALQGLLEPYGEPVRGLHTVSLPRICIVHCAASYFCSWNGDRTLASHVR